MRCGGWPAASRTAACQACAQRPVNLPNWLGTSKGHGSLRNVGNSSCCRNRASTQLGRNGPRPRIRSRIVPGRLVASVAIAREPSAAKPSGIRAQAVCHIGQLQQSTKALARDRFAELVRNHLGVDRELDFDADFGDTDVSSMEAVAFMREVSREFGLRIPPRDFAKIHTLGQPSDYVDSHSGGLPRTRRNLAALPDNRSRIRMAWPGSIRPCGPRPVSVTGDWSLLRIGWTPGSTERDALGGC